MIKEVHLIHHSHTDIGYTHPQPVIFELHRRFIDEALDLADELPVGDHYSRFKWTCEVTGTTKLWWDSASNESRDRFIAAVKRGQIEVAAMQWHFTPLADLSMLIKSLENVKFFRDLGVPIRSAMNTDVNGVPWGLIDVLLDHGINGFSMSANSHFGGPVTPRPGAFNWRSPSGREITVWNGFQYWHVANGLMKLPSSIDEARDAVTGVVQEAERRGYPLDFLPLQITCPSHPDNAGPDARLTHFIKEWNESAPAVKLKTALLSEEFDLLRLEELPTMSGDWTDYWNFGAGSSARETATFFGGLAAVSAANGISAWAVNDSTIADDHLDLAGQALALYAEHTWGADCSINSPEADETYVQWSKKSSYAYEGVAHARIALNDGLHALADRAGGEAETLLLYNSLPVPVTRWLKLPIQDLGWALTPGTPHRMRLDSALANLPDFSKRWCQVELPALGYRTFEVAGLSPQNIDGLVCENLVISSDRVRIEFFEGGGVRSLQLDGVEVVGLDQDYFFGVPVLERPMSGVRNEIMKLDFSQYEPADNWNPLWKRVTTKGELFDSGAKDEGGAVSYSQTFLMENGDKVTAIYRLFAGEPTVDLEVVLTSAGDAKPYSLGLPFVSCFDGSSSWHFDTAGAVVEFDREQLPNACRHYVTSQHFVRHQGRKKGLTIASQNLALWRFGGLSMNYSANLDLSKMRPITMAWLSNNYWEVNFLANQKGETRYRMTLIPHQAEEVGSSVTRALPYSVDPAIFAYRDRGTAKCESGGLLKFTGSDCKLESVSRLGSDLVLVVQNLNQEESVLTLSPDVVKWERSSLARLDGTPLGEPNESHSFSIPARAVVGIRLFNCSERGT